MTTLAQHRLKGYLRTFIVMTICGFLLMVGGGSFFIYESIRFANQAKSDDAYRSVTKHEKSNSSTTQRHQNQSSHVISRHNPDESLRHRAYASELRTIGFIFLGTGFLLFAVGLPLAYQFWKRYRRSKDTERHPIVEASAPEQSSLPRHNWNGINSNDNDFENPIHLKPIQTVSNEENLLLHREEGDQPSYEISTRNSSQICNSFKQQDSANVNLVTLKRPSLFDKMFAITDDDNLSTVDDEEVIFDGASADANERSYV